MKATKLARLNTNATEGISIPNNAKAMPTKPIIAPPREASLQKLLFFIV